MVDLLLDLDLVPVREALEATVLVIVGKREVQVSGVELLVDLLLKHLCDILVHSHMHSVGRSGACAQPEYTAAWRGKLTMAAR